MVRYFLILILIVSSQSGFADTKETYRQLSIFNEVYNRVKNQYVEELTDKELVEKALNGMLQALDPHSSYMNEEVYKEMQVDTAGAFGGLGIEITTDKSFIKIGKSPQNCPYKKMQHQHICLLCIPHLIRGNSHQRKPFPIDHFYKIEHHMHRRDCLLD